MSWVISRWPSPVPAAHLLAHTGVAVECLDLAVEPWDPDKVRRADVVGISVPMHTALRLGVQSRCPGAFIESHVSYLLLRTL